MQIQVDVYTPAGVRLTDGPIISAKAVSVTRTLDGAGSISIDFPASDRRVIELLTNKRRCHVLIDRGELREIGRLIVEKSGLKLSSGSWVRTVDGPDNLGELKFKNVLRGRKFDAATVDNITDTLLGLLSTSWVRSGSVTNTVSARFDGASVLKALVELVKQQGIHFRQSSTFNTIEIGAFGDSATLEDGTPLVIENNAAYVDSVPDHVLLISELTLLEDSEELINWLEPIGAGDGDAAITLEKSTRTTPYTIQTTAGPDSRTVYYLADSTSVTAYGQVEKVGAFKDITLVGTSEAAQVAAANALYDLAVATLLRFKDPYKSYQVELRNPPVNILPGDKVRLLGNFEVKDPDGKLIDILDVDAEFWIMKVSETLGGAGHTVKLQIANIDRHMQDEAEIVIDAIEDIRLSNVSVKPYFNKSNFPDAFEVDSTHPATFQINVTTRTQAINLATLRVITSPFRSTSTTAASGGGSTSGGGGSSTETSTATGLSTGLMIPVGGDHRHDIVPHDHDVSIPSHTHSTPNHSHSLDFAISDDTDYPDNVAITVDGQSVASGLDPSGTGLDQTFDITDELNASTLQALHTITISCTGGQGRVKVLVELYETIQSVSKFA